MPAPASQDAGTAPQLIPGARRTLEVRWAGVGQAGKRPALVLSPAAYNGRVGLALLCPITSQRKGYPYAVPHAVLDEAVARTRVLLEPEEAA